MRPGRLLPHVAPPGPLAGARRAALMEHRPSTALRGVAGTGVVAGLVLVLAACGGSASSSGGSSATASSSASSLSAAGSSSTAGTSASSSPGSASSSTAAPAVRTLRITVTGKQVTPAPTRVPLRQGERLRLLVTVDHDDELHLHGFDIERPVKAGQPLTVDVTGGEPGLYEVETHEPPLRLLQILVR